MDNGIYVWYTVLNQVFIYFGEEPGGGCYHVFSFICLFSLKVGNQCAEVQN